MLVSELLLLLDQLVRLLMKSQQVRIELLVVVVFTMLPGVHLVVGLESLLQIIPVVLFFLFVVRRVPFFAGLNCLRYAWFFLLQIRLARIRWLRVRWLLLWRVTRRLLSSSPSASLSFFWLAALRSGSHRVDWILRSRLWFWDLGLGERLWLNILDSVVLLVLGQVADVGGVFVLGFLFLLEALGVSECVDGVVSGRRARVDARNHYDL